MYTETRGAGQPWLSAPILSFIPSHSFFSPTRCVNPTHLFLHFWVQSRPPLLASSHVPHTNPSSSTWKGCSFPLSAGLLTCIHMHCLAQQTIPNGAESCGCSCQHSLLQLPTAPQQLGPTAEPSQMRFIPSSSPSGELAWQPALLVLPGAPQSLLGMLVLDLGEQMGVCGAPVVLIAVR